MAAFDLHVSLSNNKNDGIFYNFKMNTYFITLAYEKCSRLALKKTQLMPPITVTVVILKQENVW